MQPVQTYLLHHYSLQGDPLNLSALPQERKQLFMFWGSQQPLLVGKLFMLHLPLVVVTTYVSKKGCKAHCQGNLFVWQVVPSRISSSHQHARADGCWAGSSGFSRSCERTFCTDQDRTAWLWHISANWEGLTPLFVIWGWTYRNGLADRGWIFLQRAFRGKKPTGGFSVKRTVPSFRVVTPSTGRKDDIQAFPVSTNQLPCIIALSSPSDVPFLDIGSGGLADRCIFHLLDSHG